MRIFKWVVGGMVVALIAAGIWWQRTRTVEAELLAAPPFRILKQHDPSEYARILDAWREFKSGRRSQPEFVRESNALFSHVATRRLGSASQPSVLALMHDTVRTVKKLHAKSPEACFRYFYPEVAGAPDVTGILTAEEQRHTLELMGEVVRSAAESPAARPEASEVEHALAGVINATYEQFGTDAQMVAHPEDPRIDRGKVCVITTSLYERILALPPEVSTKLIRFMAPAGGGGR
jgi:hypothetical protein